VQSSPSTNRVDAVRLLKRKLGEVGRGIPSPEVEGPTLDGLCEMLRHDYRTNQRRSLDRIGPGLAHLKEFFGDAWAQDITTDRITAYVLARQAERAAKATINRELAAPSGCFAWPRSRASRAAALYPNAPRGRCTRGVLRGAECAPVLAELPDSLKPLAEVAHVAGWRIGSELLSRRWTHVDFSAEWIRLEPGELKNRENRMFPLRGKPKIGGPSRTRTLDPLIKSSNADQPENIQHDLSLYDTDDHE